MKVSVKLEKGMRLAGKNESGLVTYFDTHKEFGGDDSAPTPMVVMLESLAGCTAMDVLTMLRKRKKTITDFEIEVDGERASEHPKVFIKANLIFKLTSPDTKTEELEQAIKLSQDKYCSVSAMFNKSGCNIQWKAILNPD